MFIKRSIIPVVKQLNEQYPIIIFTGALGTGKRTLLDSLETVKREKLSLENAKLRMLAEKHPAEFVNNLRPPVTISNIQYGLNLMPYITQRAIREQRKGDYWLIGSHMSDLFDQEGASLGEHIGVVKLTGLTYEEITGEELDFTAIQEMQKPLVKNQILRGSMPELYENGNFDNRNQYYDNLVQEFLRTEIKHMAKVSNVMDFRRFMVSVATRSGEMVNYANLAKDADISQPTAKQWLSVLVEGGWVSLLQPYRHPKLSRVIDVPRMFFMDTGLCSYLAGTNRVDRLFKTWVLSELFKQYYNKGVVPPLYHYRDKDCKEVDLIIDGEEGITPIKIVETGAHTVKNKLYFNGFQKKDIKTFLGKTISFNKKI